MRIFVGTLYTIENEFDECLASIERQSYRNFRHFIFKGLPLKEAYHTLFQAFMERAAEFDLLAKIDADMVLEDRHLFEKVVRKLNDHESVCKFEIAVHDFFPNQLVWGMSFYRNRLRWGRTDENLFLEAMTLPPGQYLDDFDDLAPAAVHCRNPSPFQAFHYGVYRGLKVIQTDRPEMRTASARLAWHLMERTLELFRAGGDRRRGFASLGAELALRGRLRPEHLDYSNPHLTTLFHRYQDLTADQLGEKIDRLRRTNWGRLSSGRRREMLTYLRGGRYTSLVAAKQFVREFIRNSRDSYRYTS